ncbi:hypothetical protein GVAV_000054 [Gurleya vavrai]
MHEELSYHFKTTRTKCLAFHHTKPVILSAHHTSHIQCYDLHLNTLIYTFLGHDGPVRALEFHPKSEIFLSGGDDTKVILWSFALKKQLYAFKGHSDYVRCVNFHPVNPWFLSTSDDQTIKIWNFQSYKLLASISGHTHYVMSANFVNDILVSASLDQTIRLWDYSGLNGKKESNLLGVPNVFVKQIVEAHERGINCIAKHPTKNIIATGGDDRLIKVWDINDSLIEKECYYHHTGNVSSILFLEDFLLSCGEDGIIGIEGKNYSRKIIEDTRFWNLACNPDRTMFAVGYDSGIKIYNTKKRGIVYFYDGANVFYLQNESIIKNNLENEISVAKIKKEIEKITTNDDLIAIQYFKSYDIFKDKKIINRGSGQMIFINNQVLCLDKNELSINGKFVCEIQGSHKNDVFLQKFDKNSFFIVKNQSVELFDLLKKEIVFLIKINDIKQIINGEKYIAMLSKRKFFIFDKKFNLINSFDEMVEINHGFFEENTFFYSTMRHIKYIIDDCKGILRSMEKETHLLFKNNDLFFYMTNEGLENVSIDLTEYKFKKAVNENNKTEIRNIIKSSKIPGTSIYDYLVKKGIGDSILEHLKDGKKKIEILMEIGKFEECFYLIKNDNALYSKLYEKSMNALNLNIAEKCLWKMKDFYGLFMFYICCNQKEKLKKLYKYGDDAFKINIAIVLNEKELIKKMFFKKERNLIFENEEYKSNESDDNNPKFDMQSKNDNTNLNVNKKDDNLINNSEDDEFISESNVKIEATNNIFFTNDQIDKSELKGDFDSTENDEITKKLEKINFPEELKETENNHIEKNICVYENIVDFELLKNKIDLNKIISNYEEIYDNAMDYTTEGKFTTAINFLKEILYSLVQNNDENEILRRKIGLYLSGLSVEKGKKKIDDNQSLLNMGKYFASLNLLEKHQILAKSNFMILCYKNENFDSAKIIANELKGKVDGNLDKMVNKILKSSKSGDKIEFENGDFCFDTNQFSKITKECLLCYTKSSKGEFLYLL